MNHDIKHIAIIMDGNRRWAENKLLPRKVGHREGAKNLQNIVSSAIKENIQFLTLYAFSTENWNREQKEIDELFSLLNHFLDEEVKKLKKENVRINVIGDLSKFPEELQIKIKKTINDTKDYTKITLNIALNYGSRNEIISAIQNIKPEDIQNLTEEKFNQYLYTSQSPYPDLIIRTGGEYRLSNFLLWQAAYSELYFTEKLWPEFTPQEFQIALNNYKSRSRRQGH
jgi:undecaprenyl diphosphate synthase